MDTPKPRIPLSDKAKDARRRPNYFLLPGMDAPPVPSTGKGRIVKVRRAPKSEETTK